MKASRTIAALLALLGFGAAMVGCKPDEKVKPGCDPEGSEVMYGVIPCSYESKSAVPREPEPSGDSVDFLGEIESDESR